MTVFVITHTQRGEEQAEILSVHASLDGAKAALIEWARDRWDERTDRYLAKYLGEDGRGLYTEDDTLQIGEEPILP